MGWPTTDIPITLPVGGTIEPNGRSRIVEHFNDDEQHLTPADRTYFDGLPVELDAKLEISDQRLAQNAFDGNTVLSSFPLGLSVMRVTNVAAGMPPVSTNYNVLIERTTSTTGVQTAKQASDPVRVWNRRWDTTLNSGAGGWLGWVEVGSTIRQATQSGTTYTLALADAGSVVHMSNAASNVLTVPPNSSVAFPLGTVIGVYQQGAGQTTVAAGAGVTVRNSGALRAQYAQAALRKIGTDEWVLSGALA